MYFSSFFSVYVEIQKKLHVSKRKALAIEQKANMIWHLESGERKSVFNADFDIFHNNVPIIKKSRKKKFATPLNITIINGKS